MGCELAQAFRRLGSDVVMSIGPILPREDPELAEVTRIGLAEAELHEHARVARVEPGPTLILADAGPLHGTHLLVAAGREATVDGLGLEAAGVATDAKGIKVDARPARPTPACSRSATSRAARSSPMPPATRPGS